MAVKISGVLKDGAGKPVQNCTIQLKAKRNSTTVVVNTVASENPDEAGRYSMDVEYGQYSVILLVEGFPPSHAGTITVYEDSQPGTLNDFLGAMTEDDARPEALRRFELMVEEVARNASAVEQNTAAAKKSASDAGTSAREAATHATDAADSARAASTSAGQAASSAQSASSSAGTASTKATEASKSAAAAESSKSAAATSAGAAKTSETNAAASQKSAATSASTATTKASEAATSARDAAASKEAAKSSETNASSSASSAASSATAAGNSAKAAKTSETNADNSAQAAADSQTASANSATAAKKSETNAKNSEAAAKSSETNAKASETNAKSSETNAAKSAADALNYCNQAQVIVGDNIGLGSAPRDCPDISGNPSGYIGFMRIMSNAKGFPSIASGESSLTGFISQVDGTPAYTGVFQGWATRSLYTYRWNPTIGPQWTRHARKDEVIRFQRSSDTRTIILSTDVQADGCYLQVDAGGQWGAFNPKAGSWQPLAVAQGGTGARDTATARTNLGLGTGNDPQFQNLKLTRKSDGTTGWVAGGLLKSQLYSTTDTLRVEGLVYAETGLASPSQLTISIYTPSEGQKYFSFNTKGQILAETAIFRSTYANPLIIQSATPTINFNETDRPSGAPYYNFIFDGGNWRIQKEGDGHNGEYIISYEYANDRIVIPNLKVEDLYAPADKVQQIKNNLLIPNTGLSRWYDYAAPAGAEANKFYPVVISHPAGWNGDAFVEVSMRTRSLSGNQEPNCNAIYLWMRDAGWSDMGQACFGHYHAYDSSEVAILCVRGTDKGQYPHNVVYVRGDAFPIRLAATVGSTITIPTSDWKPATSADSPTYLWGISNANEGLSIDTYGIGANLLNFSGGRSGFYSDKTFRDLNGGEYLARTCSVGSVDITATDKFNWRGVSNFHGTVNGGAGFFATSDNLSGCSFISKLLNGSGATIGQTELRAGENQGQIVVRDLTSAQVHRFFNFNKDGTFSAPSGIVTHTGVDLNGQQSDNVNKFKPIAGQVNAPENNMVYGGIHVGFSGNYGAQLVMRNDKAYFRTIEKGTEGTWKRLASMESGRLKVIGSATNRESMDCNIVGYDANGQNMSWFLGQYGNVQYRTYFEDYLGGAGVELNGDDGSVKLYSGGMTTTNPSSLKLDDDSVQLSVPLHLNNGVSSKYLQIINDPTSNVGIDEHMIVQAWGNGSDRKSVFEVKLSSGYIFYAQKNGDNSRNLQVAGSINCTTLNQSSDRDLKENIQVISGATEALRKMSGYTYTMKSDGMPYAGVIAQEVMEAIPEAVGSFTHYGEELQGPTVDGNELREETRYLNVDYAAVTGLLVQVARETDDRVTALEEENTTLRENLATAGTRISTLENQVSELVALVRQLTGSEH